MTDFRLSDTKKRFVEIMRWEVLWVLWAASHHVDLRWICMVFVEFERTLMKLLNQLQHSKKQASVVNNVPSLISLQDCCLRIKVISRPGEASVSGSASTGCTGGVQSSSTICTAPQRMRWVFLSPVCDFTGAFHVTADLCSYQWHIWGVSPLNTETLLNNEHHSK